MNKPNIIKQHFRELFLKQIEKWERGFFVNDNDIKNLCSKNNISLLYSEIMFLIRQMEDKIGIIYKKRFKRIRNEGYLILEPKEQASIAIEEGKYKVERALKKTGKRLTVVDTTNFTPEQSKELLKRTEAVNSFLQIIKNSSITKKIANRKEIELLSLTASQSKALNQLNGEDL